MQEVDVSIVICTYRRPDGLRDALASLIRQETNGDFTYEIVVVQNYPTDGSDEVIAEIAASSPVPLRGVHEHRRGQVVARNRGLAEARGEWIANFDDDQVAEPFWLRELWTIAHEKNTRSVGGALFLRFPDGCSRPLSPRARRMLGETVVWHTARPYTRKQGPGSGNQMLHRSIFDELGKYDESFTLRGYDTDMYRRIREANIVSWFTPKAIGYHITPADRLTDEYFRETSLHNGWSFARRDLLERGRPLACLSMLARWGQSLLFTLPRLGFHRLKGNAAGVLDARICLWRAEGYGRSVLYALAPKLFKQDGFFSRYEFRAEKRLPPAGAERPVAAPEPQHAQSGASRG